jgi:hypothetical protein
MSGDFKIKLSKYSAYAISALLFSLVLDVGGAFWLKYMSLTIACIVTLVLVTNCGVYKKFLIDGLVFGFFACSALVSIMRGAPFELALSEVSFLAFFVILLLGEKVNRQFLESLFVRASLLAALIVLVTFFLILVFPQIALIFTGFADENRLGYIGFRAGGEGLPNIYYRWSAWLILGFSLSLYAKKYLISIIIAMASFLTLSTAIIAGILLVLIFYGAFGNRSGYSRFSKILIIYTILPALFALSVFMFPEVVSEILSKFSTQSDSTSVKLGHIQSIFALLNLNPLYLFFGQGVGTSFYSTGVNGIISNVEVSYFNLLRQFGAIGCLIFFGYVFFVVTQLMKIGKAGQSWGVGLSVLFLVAGTNPILLSPIFIVPLMMGRVYSIEFIKVRSYAR